MFIFISIADHGNYDFIIVGAGSAGSVLANRLTESGQFKVLLLEAGGREDDFTDVPGFAPFLIRSDFNWGYKTIPQKNCCLGKFLFQSFSELQPLIFRNEKQTM